jgi:hypothetical protein
MIGNGVTEIKIEEYEGYEVYNKLNNNEPFLILQFFIQQKSNLDEYLLRNAIPLLYDIAGDDSYSFKALKEQLFPPIVSKNDLKRKFLFIFNSSIDENIIEQEVKERILKKFFSFIDERKQDIDNLEEVEEEEYQVAVLKGYFENEFHNRYSHCKLFYQRTHNEHLLKPTFIEAYYMSEILKGFLFLGDHISASDKEQLSGLGITHIIDATNNLSFTSQRVAYDLGITHLPIAIWDDEGVNIIDEVIPKIINFIQKAKEENSQEKGEKQQEKQKENRILIHCQAGISRSASLLISYLMRDQTMSLKDAFIHVLKQRPLIHPNKGFRCQLLKYEEIIFEGKQSVADDDELLSIISQHNTMWISQPMTRGNEFDRIPIRVMRERNVLLQEQPEEITLPEDVEQKKKVVPKKEFLKRGTGKSVHQKPTKNKEINETTKGLAATAESNTEDNNYT